MNGIPHQPTSISLDPSSPPCSNLSNDLPLVRPRETSSLNMARISQVPLPLSNVQNIPIDISFPSQSSPLLDSSHIDPSCKFSEHIKKMKMIQLSSSSLSDFITPRFNLKNSYPCTRVSLLHSFFHRAHSLTVSAYHDGASHVHHSLVDCSSQVSNAAAIDENSLQENQSFELPQRRSANSRGILTNGLLLSPCSSTPLHRRAQELFIANRDRPSVKWKLTDRSTSDTCSSSSDENLLSRSDFLRQQEVTPSHHRKSSSLKAISHRSTLPSSPKILYPIAFPEQSCYHQQPTFHSPQSSIAAEMLLDPSFKFKTGNVSVRRSP